MTSTDTLLRAKRLGMKGCFNDVQAPPLPFEPRGLPVPPLASFKQHVMWT